MRKISSNLKRSNIKRYKESKLGLHCHCSETKQDLINLLRQAKKENVRYLAINNYKSIRIFTEVLPKITDDELNEFKQMRLIPSIEMPGNFNFTNLNGENYNIETHIIGYGIDIEKEKLLERFVDMKYKSLNQEEELQRLINIGHQLGLSFDDRDAYLDYSDDNRKFAGRAFMQALMQNIDINFCKEGENNRNKLPAELRTNWRAFQNRCLKDLHSPFYLDVSTLNPPAYEVIDLIHSMGGKAYLAHPSAYFSKNLSKSDIQIAYDNTVEFARQFIDTFSPRNNLSTKIDGVEIYHPSYQGDLEVTGEMTELIKTYRLASSGGTDIHIDKTTSKNETISSDSLGNSVTIKKLRKFRYLRANALSVENLKHKVLEINKKSEPYDR